MRRTYTPTMIPNKIAISGRGPEDWYTDMVRFGDLSPTSYGAVNLLHEALE